MTEPILVTGGTGHLGRALVPRLRRVHPHVRVLSRREHEPDTGIEYVVGDLTTGDGIEAAVAGVATIVHCGGNNSGDDVMTRHLVDAAGKAGVRHLVFISVVGADRMPVTSRTDRAMFGYFAKKRAAERIIADSGLPWTTLRASQFHELALIVSRSLAKLPVVPVMSGVRFQPVDIGEVADRLVELAMGEPAGLVPDLAGPVAYDMADLVRGYLKATGRRRLLVPIRLPGGAARAVRAGANLPTGPTAGRRSWEEFLAAL